MNHSKGWNCTTTDCKNCKWGYTVKCESGEEYICCHMQKCQEEKKKEGAE